MKLIFESPFSDQSASFRFRHVHTNGFDFNWHFHDEIELTLILKGSGRRFIGDNITHFSDDDLVLIGSNLPHTWYSRKSEQNKCEAIVVQFDYSFLGEDFFHKPEMHSINQLLTHAELGTIFSAEVVKSVKIKLLGMQALNTFERCISLLQILHELSKDKNSKHLSSPWTFGKEEEKSIKKVDDVCNYINENYSKQIQLSEVSQIAALSEQAFCRFFKKATGKTFVHYLNEIRIGKACQLLIETDLSISEVSYKVGFNKNEFEEG